MAITFDNSDQQGFSSNFNFPYTVGSGDNRFLALVFNYNRGLSSITFNSVNADGGTELNDSGVRLWMYYWINPPTGLNDFDVTFSAISSFQGGALGISLFGVDQINPLGSAADAYQEYVGGTSTDLDITLSYANSWTLEGQASDISQAITQDDSQTEREEAVTANAGDAVATKSHTATGSTNLGFSVAGSAGLWHIVWEIVEAGARGGGTMYPFFLDN